MGNVIFVSGFVDGAAHPYLIVGLRDGRGEYLHDAQALGAFEMLIGRPDTTIVTDSYLGLHTIKLLCGSKGWFDDLIDVRAIREPIEPISDRLAPHRRAAETCGVDWSKSSMQRILPKNVIHATLKGLERDLIYTFDDLDEAEVKLARESGDCIQALSDVELRGIPHAPGILKFPSFNYLGSTTRRILTNKGTWSCMTLAKDGPERHAIRSRHGTERGSIVSLDFNAIDCRSLVGMFPGSLQDLYRDAPDFHARTADVSWGDAKERRRAKAMTTALLYGGSEATAAVAAGCTLDELRERWLPGFKRTFSEVWPRRGPELGVECQTRSARAFRAAVGAAGRFIARADHANKIDILIPVHDELVLDVRSDMLAEITDFLIPSMEGAAESISGVQHRVRFSSGSSYAEATGSAAPVGTSPT